MLEVDSSARREAGSGFTQLGAQAAEWNLQSGLAHCEKQLPAENLFAFVEKTRPKSELSEWKRSPQAGWGDSIA
jgi:hypothetical protein